MPILTIFKNPILRQLKKFGESSRKVYCDKEDYAKKFKKSTKYHLFCYLFQKNLLNDRLMHVFLFSIKLFHGKTKYKRI